MQARSIERVDRWVPASAGMVIWQERWSRNEELAALRSCRVLRDTRDVSRPCRRAAMDDPAADADPPAGNAERLRPGQRRQALVRDLRRGCAGHLVARWAGQCRLLGQSG